MNDVRLLGDERFLQDVFVILTSSCARLLPRRRGYNQLPSSTRGRGSREEENGKAIHIYIISTSIRSSLIPSQA